MKKTKLAVIVGNRDFFPDELVTEARQDILAVFNEMDIEPVMLAEEKNNVLWCTVLSRTLASRALGR